jgi:hypothetical protein
MVILYATSLRRFETDCQASTINGGGGGNRTRVRKPSTARFYMFSPSTNLTGWLPTDRSTRRPSPLEI